MNCFILCLLFVISAEAVAKNTTEGRLTSERERACFHHKYCFPEIGCFFCKRFGIGIWPLMKCYKPWSPLKIDTSLLLLTRKERKAHRLPSIYPDLPKNLTRYGYDPDKRTVFIIHGFTGDSSVPWMNEIAQAYLDKKDANVIWVDWKKGASGGFGPHWNKYGVAASNTQIVGAVVARFAAFLVKHYKQDIKSIHVIGFSLGAQVAGFIGSKMKEYCSSKEKKKEDNKNGCRPGKITGLDPAGPGFERYPGNAHLTAADADYVEVVHTNGLGSCRRPAAHIPSSGIIVPNFFGLGTAEPIGTIDFYMNGGGRQPGCLFNGPENERGYSEIEIAEMSPQALTGWSAFCSHMMAPNYYVSALKHEPKVCAFMGHKLTQKQEDQMFKDLKLVKMTVFHPNDLPPCRTVKNNCLPLKLSSSEDESVKGVVYTPVSPKEPWCVKMKN